MGPKAESYKKAIANADPVGEYVNDNVMTTNVAIVLEDGDKAREVATDAGTVNLHAGVHRYHSTMPRKDGIPSWPEVLPDPNREMIEAGIQGGFLVCGDPDEAIEQLKRYEATGVDQVAFSVPIDIPQDVCLETIRLLGEHVIPKFDEPEFRTDRFRASADVPPGPPRRSRAPTVRRRSRTTPAPGSRDRPAPRQQNLDLSPDSGRRPRRSWRRGAGTGPEPRICPRAQVDSGVA